MLKLTKIVLVFFCFLSGFGIVSGQMPDWPADVEKALQDAGENRTELEKVLEHYGQDSLKLQAAYYLIGNMEGHSYVTYSLRDTLGTDIPFNVLDYPNYEALLAAFDTLQTKYGPLDFEKKDLIEDLKTITADFLINQTDLAFRAWREKPWARELSFDQFCRYVLPYRGSNELLDPWREYFWNKYASLEDKLSDSTDPIAVAKLINEDVKSWFSFDPRYYFHPTDQGLTEMLEKRLGRCEDMTNLTIYAMRANGLAVTSDYTPFWANTGNNHVWNAIVTPAGKAIPFMGAEANPGDYHLANKLAKAYRKTYEKHPENLIYQPRKQEKVPGWLAGKSYVDVTADYVPTCQINIELREAAPDSVDIAYLCVFNTGEWQAIHWGRIKDGIASFTDMGTDVVYLPAYYLNEKIVPAGAPFLLSADCGITEFIPNEKQEISLQLTSTTRRQLEVSTDGIARTFLSKGKKYELFYWKDGWKSCEKKTAKDKPLVYKHIPAQGLYWLMEDGSDREERIFTIEDGKQIWW